MRPETPAALPAGTDPPGPAGQSSVWNHRPDLHRQLLDAVQCAIIATDPGGTIVYWNRFAEPLALRLPRRRGRRPARHRRHRAAALAGAGHRDHGLPRVGPPVVRRAPGPAPGRHHLSRRTAAATHERVHLGPLMPDGWSLSDGPRIPIMVWPVEDLTAAGPPRLKASGQAVVLDGAGGTMVFLSAPRVRVPPSKVGT
jgi:hypothetical protein